MAKDLKPIKKLGQNFLTDKSITRRMVDALEISDNDTIIEIGPGLGALTSLILEISQKAKLFAVEIDPRYVDELKQKFADKENFEIIHQNILDWLPEFKNPKPETPVKIIGSLPYYITSPIVHEIIKMEKMPETIVLLVQKEVAEKICSLPPDSSYFSSFVQIFYQTVYLFKVDKSKFKPRPQVDGAVLKLAKRPSGDFAGLDKRKMEGFLHKAYANPRKMLNKAFDDSELKKAGIDGSLRPQNIDPDKWVEAYKILVG